MELQKIAKDIQETLDALRNAAYSHDSYTELQLRESLNAFLYPLGFKVTNEQKNIYRIISIQ